MYKVIMSYYIRLPTQLGYLRYSCIFIYCNGFAILLTDWASSCEVVWLAWLQLPYGAVVFNVLASNGAVLAALSALPAPSDSRILSKLGSVLGIVLGTELGTPLDSEC
jgi:hypothetical protein